MRRPAVRMLLLIDESVPDSVTRFCRERGHDVRLVRDLFPVGTPDPVIATLGDPWSAVVVTWNYRDFKALASRIPPGNRRHFRRLSMIAFRCRESHGARRLADEMDMIEYAYERAQARGDKRLFAEITETTIVFK
jgi:hypothetical protein